MFTSRELALLAMLVDQETEDEEYLEAWSSRDREVFDQIRIKLNPEVQDEIRSLEESLMRPQEEGEVMKGIKKDWFVSSATTPANNCVEARIFDDGSVEVRNSNDRGGPSVLYTADEWSAFLVGAKKGEFDL